MRKLVVKLNDRTLTCQGNARGRPFEAAIARFTRNALTCAQLVNDPCRFFL
jgi:hypothetical protein